MFSIAKINFIADPKIDVAIDEVYYKDPSALEFFDKDGYELTKLEQIYYTAQGYKVVKYTADHPGVFQPWITVDHEYLSVDHSCAMYRCDFVGSAKEQVERQTKRFTRAGWLLTCKKKWGLDLDIDYCDGNIALEVIHLEWDSPTLEKIEQERVKAEELVKNTDWVDAAKRVWSLRDEWQNLKGWYAQAHWKATYFGLERPWY
jgi:hypothetical protein